MNNLFQKATKNTAKLRLALSGPSGSGKTYTALLLASNLCTNGKPPKVAVADTEHGSASKYADLFDFDVVNFESPFHPDRYGKLIQMAGENGYDVLVIDSLSHAWNGTGGMLEIVDELKARNRSNNSMAVWQEATPIHNRLIENIIAAPLHIIATMRSKQEYLIEKDDGGKVSVRKMGLAPIQRDGMEYEFDVWGEMDINNRLIVSKTRCPELNGRVIEKPGAEMAEALCAWLVTTSSSNGTMSPGEVSEKLYSQEAV